MIRSNVMNPLWFERPSWFAIDRLMAKEEAHEMEDFIYHRRVLEREVVKLLEPKPGSLIVDATCGGGGHTETLFGSGADVLALDQDPDAVQHVNAQLARFARRVSVFYVNFRTAATVFVDIGYRT